MTLITNSRAQAATPSGFACDYDGSTSVESCIYIYGYNSGTSFVLDHYGATFLRLDSQTRLTSGVVTVVIFGRVEAHTFSAPTSGVEYSFKPSWSGSAIKIDSSGRNYQCGQALLNWARGTATHAVTSGNVTKGSCSGFADGGGQEHAIPAVVTWALKAQQMDQKLDIGDGLQQTVRTEHFPAREVSIAGRRLTAVSVVVGVLDSTPKIRLVSSVGNCANDSSFSVSVCVTQYFSRSGNYVSLDHYDLVASRTDSQARLTSSLLRAGVLGACQPGSCTGTLNDSQDFSQSSPVSNATYSYYPRWHGKYTQVTTGRYQCANAWLNWTRGTRSYQISMIPATCQGSY